MQQSDLQNEKVKTHKFLAEMYADPYFPKHLVEKGKNILVKLAHKIEVEKPADLEGLYALTHPATVEFNELQEEFAAEDSDIETGAREAIAEDFHFLATAYGFELDDEAGEEIIGPREW